MFGAVLVMYLMFLCTHFILHVVVMYSGTCSCGFYVVASFRNSTDGDL